MVPKLGALGIAVSRVKLKVLTGTNVPIAWADSLFKVLPVPGFSLEEILACSLNLAFKSVQVILALLRGLSLS